MGAAIGSALSFTCSLRTPRGRSNASDRGLRNWDHLRVPASSGRKSCLTLQRRLARSRARLVVRR